MSTRSSEEKSSGTALPSRVKGSCVTRISGSSPGVIMVSITMVRAPVRSMSDQSSGYLSVW